MRIQTACESIWIVSIWITAFDSAGGAFTGHDQNIYTIYRCGTALARIAGTEWTSRA
jgi:hypothetical protein